MSQLSSSICFYIEFDYYPEYGNFSEKLKFLTRTCAYQGVRNVSFSENFAFVLNEWFQTSAMDKTFCCI